MVLIETTAGVTFHNATCDTAASVTYANADEVTYAVTGGSVAAGQSVEITATAKDGFTLGEGQSVFTFTFAAAPTNCAPPPVLPTEVTPGVTFQDPTCDVGAAVVPTTATGLTYAIEGNVGPGEHVKVTATANDGYTIRGNNTWEHTFGPVPSNCTAPPPPAVTPPSPPPTETTPAAPLTPPTTGTKPAERTPPAKPKPAPKPAPLTPPKTAVKGAESEAPTTPQAQPELAYTP